jgi:hypothetical protein
MKYATKIVMHTRVFDKDLQETLSLQCHSKEYLCIWRDFDRHPILKREIDMGIEFMKRLLPECLHNFIEYKVDPFIYSMEFFILVGGQDEKDYFDSEEISING